MCSGWGGSELALGNPVMPSHSSTSSCAPAWSLHGQQHKGIAFRQLKPEPRLSCQDIVKYLYNLNICAEVRPFGQLEYFTGYY